MQLQYSSTQYSIELAASTRVPGTRHFRCYIFCKREGCCESYNAIFVVEKILLRLWKFL